MAETKTWLTPKRIARGPEAANEELRRWARAKRQRELGRTVSDALKPALVYRSTADMRHDEEASRRRHVGSVVMSREPRGIGLGHVAIGAAAIGAGFLVGRWWARRRRAAQTTVAGCDTSTYERGLDALATL